jgi:hypothetical protein
MKRYLFLGSMIFVLSLLSSGILASDPLDYKVIYQNRWTHDEQIRNVKTTVLSQANLKFRIESEYVDDSSDTAKAMLNVWIVRLDKHVTWRLNASKNICLEQPYDESRMGRSFYISEERRAHLKKVGEEKILGYPCEIFTDSGISSAKYWISKEHSILLKAEYEQDGVKYTSEATELSFEPQDNSAFDVPQDYKMLRIMSKEELDNLPPVTLKDIHAAFFKEYASFQLSPGPGRAVRTLTLAEIEILKDSFLNGSHLEEISNETLSTIANQKTPAVFTIKWTERESGSFWFSNGYIYISKMSVFHNELDERYFDVNWVKKFIQGAYRFKPSSAITKLLK